jgi:protein TonB
MLAALGLLLFALGFVLYSNRDFWFPDASSAMDQSPSVSHAATAAPQPLEQHPVAAARKSHSRVLTSKLPDSPPAPGASVTATRTVLPPLEVQVVAGNTPRTLHPSNNSVQVDLQQGAAPSRVLPETPVKTDDTAAYITSNAAERAEVSADTSEVVSHSVTPGYPTLARQMKVQGSVVLMALIGRDGLIQDLHVLSGPPILANAAQEAVRQWHFKPHYQGIQAVETQARITVNFTISTN